MATIMGRVTNIRWTRDRGYFTMTRSHIDGCGNVQDTPDAEEDIRCFPANLGDQEYEDWKYRARIGDLVEVKGDKILDKQKKLVTVASSIKVLVTAGIGASPAPPQRSTVLGSAEQKGNTMNLSVQDAVAKFGVDIDPHLERDFEIPVLDTLQRQGDVIVIPTPKKKLPTKAKAVAAAGVPVVRGENGGNTHLLLAAGDVQFAPVDGTTQGQLDVGVFTVAEGATAYLAHPEHGYMGIAPGTYTVRRQREQADEIRQVAD